MDENNNKQTDYINIIMNDGGKYKAKYFYTYIAGEFHACSEIIARVFDIDDNISDIKFIDIAKIEYNVENMREYIERVQLICNPEGESEPTEPCDVDDDDTDFGWTDRDSNKFPTVNDSGMFG